MKILLSHPTGNANVRAVAAGLLEANLLKEYYTSIASFPGGILDLLARLGPLKELKRRSYHPDFKSRTQTWPWLEFGRLIASKVGLNELIAHERGLFCIDAVYRQLDKRIASKLNSYVNQSLGVYSYEDGAQYSFSRAKLLGMHCFYDLPIGYWKSARSLLKHEMERKPEWAATLTGFSDSVEKLQRKDEELSLADRIFVASRFTAETLSSFSSRLAPVEVIPYGFPPVCSDRIYSKDLSAPLKLLFVGGLSQRKGIADLFSVVEKLSKYVQLTVVGNKVTPDCRPLDKALSKHVWIPSLSNVAILSVMRAHDVLVFPSLFEGFGLVITEAMSQGTPVITTERTAGPDLISHGENGWIIKAGSEEALLNSIEHLLINRRSVAEVGRQAAETAKQRPWSTYGRELAGAIEKHFHSPFEIK